MKNHTGKVTYDSIILNDQKKKFVEKKRESRGTGSGIDYKWAQRIFWGDGNSSRTRLWPLLDNCTLKMSGI